jgi:hypothetical protein
MSVGSVWRMAGPGVGMRTPVKWRMKWLMPKSKKSLRNLKCKASYPSDREFFIGEAANLFINGFYDGKTNIKTGESFFGQGSEVRRIEVRWF